jgi:hypothetical protein
LFEECGEGVQGQRLDFEFFMLDVDAEASSAPPPFMQPVPAST